MKKCPNCGQAAERTEDWACLWCGYPLLSNSTKKIEKTYRQLKGEEPGKPEPPATAEPAMLPPSLQQDIVAPTYMMEPKPQSEPLPLSQPGMVPEPVPEPEIEVISEPLLRIESEVAPETSPQPEPEITTKPQPEAEPEAILEPEPEITAEPLRHESEVVPEPQAKPEIEAIPEPQSTQAPTVGGITTDDLYAEFSTDEVVADVKFKDQRLIVTGVVNRKTLNDVHHIYYVILVGTNQRERWNVRCTFDGKHRDQLNQVVVGQTVTLRGEYDGYKTNILLRNCVLVS